jgi:AraC-like DNA-binding protein
MAYFEMGYRKQSTYEVRRASEADFCEAGAEPGVMLGGIPPNQAGRETGFADRSHFTRHFRKILGITPGR